MINPEIGFTSDVITNPQRFVGRTELLRSCVAALNAPLGLIAIFGKRGVGKSSLARQIQQIALGNYISVKNAGLEFEIPENPRKYLTVYYQCDSMISNIEELIRRILNDQNEEDGLLRLVPDDGKEIVEFERSNEVSGGIDLKVINWGASGVDSTKYAKVVEQDDIQTFRNFLHAIVTHQVLKKMKRDSLLIIFDEFDVIEDKSGIGSLIKSLSSDKVKFAVCGIGNDLFELVTDHGSVERLLEEGALHVAPMPRGESKEIIRRAETLFKEEIQFKDSVINEIAEMSSGYPYMVQLMGKECVNKANTLRVKLIDDHVFKQVKIDITTGAAFPTLERQYLRAVGQSEDRKKVLYILATQVEEQTMFDSDGGTLVLKKARKDADDLEIKHIDQNLPRLIDKKFGPALRKVPDMPGYYEFVNPVFRVYCQLRALN